MKAIVKIWNRTSLIVKILIGLVLGTLFGLLLPQATFLTILGDLFVGGLKGIAPLLVFVLVISSLANASGDVLFTATAEFREWIKAGRKLPL